MTGEDVAARALALVGTRWRLHGRIGDGDGSGDASGLDCVGLVAAALDRADVPTGYGLRGGDPRVVAAVLEPRLRPARGDRPGDVVLMRTGPAQLHLGVRTATGMVHADAGLRRVVLRPGPPPWPVLAAWTGEGES